ncbi:MAG: GH3 auxin-responsive promoter family protein [Muribaculaceae bacterium]|nr:GH3 auxin-responsive promoter family protein [Muribaculaceae bacterium]
MKTDYERLGRESLERLEKSAKNAGSAQTKFLLDRLKENSGTEFGRRYGFAQINSVKEYQNKVPLSSYEDYARDIERIIGGEKNILTARDAVFFCISSGTVGDEKYIPLTEYDLEAHYTFMYGAVFGQIRNYYKELSEKEIFGKIFQIGEFAKTYMPDGRMKGIRSSCVYQWLDENGKFDASDYCVPKEILFPETLEDRLYIKVRFALAERELTAIHGVFINRAAGMIEYILRNWESLLNDMEYGTVSADIPEKQKKYIAEKLPPAPERARELRSIPRENLHKGVIKKIWKKMKYILAIGGDSFFYYTEKMRGYADGIPVHYFVYAASEGVFGLAENVGSADRYMLLPESVFFEFIAMDGDNAPLLIDEVKIGEKYELAVTNRSGLYRYRLGDVVEIVGTYEKTPIVKFCCRRNQIINIAGEKSNQQQFDTAIKRFAELSQTGVRGYCVREDFSGVAPRYLFYMECEKIPCGGDELFERCMCEANPEYKSCLHMREIEPLHIEYLKDGSFKSYERALAESGKPAAQLKMPHFLNTEEKKRFFAARTVKREGNVCTSSQE